MTYRREHLAGADAVVEAHPAVVVGVLARAEDVLVSHVVRLLIEHAVTAADTDGVAAVEVPEGVHAVTAALPVAALEVAALEEDNLKERKVRETKLYKDMLWDIFLNRLQRTLQSCEKVQIFSFLFMRYFTLAKVTETTFFQLV